MGSVETLTQSCALATAHRGPVAVPPLSDLAQRNVQLHAWGCYLTNTFRITGELAKVDESLGLVFGYVIFCEKNGKPFYDLQGDHVPEAVMLTAALDFAENSRIAGEGHTRDIDGTPIARGTVPSLFPLTKDVAKALDFVLPGPLIATRSQFGGSPSALRRAHSRRAL